MAEAARTARLTRLRIAGFKSFAEPTLVEVMAGLTGIVGPNGCGKSNIVEALRWAMGESNARTMRGGEMDDVIFAGTTSRPSRNVAEVMLTLEDACKRYSLTVEEFDGWRKSIERHGLPGLRTTRIQHYRVGEV